MGFSPVAGQLLEGLGPTINGEGERRKSSENQRKK